MADQKNGLAESKALKHRSPAYPYISLRAALERARKFYSEQRQHPAPLSAAVALWKFGPKSSGGMQMISALKQFGLMIESEVNNTRQVKLSDTALRIIQDEREISPERDAAIERLALLPKIYAEMWNKWGSPPPPDATVKFFLVSEKKYNEAAFSDLFSAYKDTIEFAKLGKTDKNAPAEGAPGEKGDGEQEHPKPPLPPRKGANLMEGERELTTGLLSKTASFRLIVSGDVGVKEIERLIAKLELDKEILAEADDSDAGDNQTSE
jgi:hypothetical protein